MQLHHKIIHHVRRHTENFVAHVNKHHKKYIAGAGVLSGMAIFKLVGIIVLFFGAARLGGSLGADYYDTEYYASLSGINISNIIQTGNNTDITGCNMTGNTLSGTKRICPTPNR